MQKKSFLLYVDTLAILDELTDEQAGKLFKAIRADQEGKEIELDSLTRIALSPFKAQFVRDTIKYKEKAERNRINGLKGGRPKANESHSNPEEPSGLFGNPENPEKPESDSDSDSLKRSKDIGDKSPVPLQEVLDAYHDILSAMPRVALFSDKRKALVRSFWKKRSAEYKENNKEFGMENLKTYFAYIATSCTWMLGSRDDGKGGMWKPKNFDYVLKDDCYIAVKEQRFDDKAA